jgi:phytanoyl-CoA hydroxylase
MAYWPNPQMTPDTRTVTFSLAFDSTNVENGCIRYIPGSGKSKVLRNHKPVASNREEGHAIAVVVGEDEDIRYAEVTSPDYSHFKSRSML